MVKTYIPSIVHESWHDEPCFDIQIMEGIRKKLGTTNISKLCPAKLPLVFSMFKMPIEKINVVIVGQDPYNNQDYANGIAFSITNTYKGIPLSLSVLAEDIHNQCAAPGVKAKDYFDYTLVELLKQGVFLLNTALTCEVDQKNAHQYIWATFTHTLFTGTFSRFTETPFYFLGSEAAKYAQFVKHSFVSSHPAAVAHGVKFEGKWNEINEFLESHGKHITWTIPF